MLAAMPPGTAIPVHLGWSPQKADSCQGKDNTMSQKQPPFVEEYWIPRGSNKLLTYVGPPLTQNLQAKDVKAFLKHKGAWGAMWNYDDGYADHGPWYRCICDTPDYDMTAIKSKNTRHNVRRSLKRCLTRPVDYQWLVDHAYEVYLKASSRYRNPTIESEAEFKQKLGKNVGIPYHKAFGVFVDDKLVAYMTLMVHGQWVMGDTAAFDHAYSRSYPMYALYYTVANHYLKNGMHKHFDRGTRPLVHETHVDDFLLQLGFRKSFCRLGVYFNWPVRLVLSLARASRPVIKSLLPKRYGEVLDALLLAQDIAAETRIS